MERTPAASDSDTATQQTVAKMWEYIRAGASDPEVKRWADLSKRFAPQASAMFAPAGLGNSPAAPLAWGIFWQVKHSVKYVRDEPRLFRMGQGDALDLLIAPAVLVRQSEPKEDCDGFTMLVCSMLDALGLGIEPFIVTIAADPQDRSRWSHVFALAKMPNGELIPLDASHGTHPGWMVPPEHTFRLQVWDRSGKPVDLPLPRHQGLHGYQRRGRMGMGAAAGLGDCDPFSGDFSTCPTQSPLQSGGGACYVGMTDPATGDTVASCGGGSPGTFTGGGITPPSSSTNWTSIFQNAINSAARVAQTAFLPTGATIRLPNGQIVSNTGAFGTSLLGAGSSLSSILPLVGVGLAVFLVINASKSK